MPYISDSYMTSLAEKILADKNLESRRICELRRDLLQLWVKYGQTSDDMDPEVRVDRMAGFLRSVAEMLGMIASWAPIEEAGRQLITELAKVSLAIFFQERERHRSPR